LARLGRTAAPIIAMLILGLVSAYSLLNQDFMVAVICIVIALTIAFFHMSLLRPPGRIKFNITYVSAILHMYGIATGEAGPKELVGVISETEEYGALRSIFRRIKVLAEKFGYGFTRATSIVAQATKPPLKDFLMRCTEIFSSRRPRDYLEIEVNTVIEEYAGMYTRALDNLRLMGGIFITFQSTVIFIVITISIFTIFLAESSLIYLSYAISLLSLILLFLGFRNVPPKDPLFYKGEETPRSHKLFAHMLAITPIFIVPSVILCLLNEIPVAFAILGVGVLIPGLFAYSLERFINNVESYYPVFIKAVSEHLISISDLKSVFSYVLYMELGPLKRLVNKALNRLRLGISAEETINLFSSETGSHSIHIADRIFLDAFRRGGDIVEVGKKLSNFVVKVLELRKRRLSVARSFEIMVMIMQPLIVILMVLLTGVLDFFSSLLINIPFFTFGKIPLGFIRTTNAAITLLLAFLNSLAVNDARGGYWGSSLLYAGILLLVSSLSWLLTEQFIVAYFTGISSDLWRTVI